MAPNSPRPLPLLLAGPSPGLDVNTDADNIFSALRVIVDLERISDTCATSKLGGNKVQFFFEILDLPIAHRPVRYGYTYMVRYA
jgi:hypothetical protein